MNINSSNESSEHKRNVAALITWFTGNGHTIVAADYPNYQRPDAMGRHIPDVIAQKGGIYSIGEAKSGLNDISTEHSKEQYSDFSGRVMKDTGITCPFYLLVPKESHAEAQEVLWQLGLDTKSNVKLLII